MRVPPSEIVKEMSSKKIEMYVCPTEGCKSAVIAKPGEKLEEEWTGPKIEDQQSLERSTHGSRFRHTRAECPDCRLRTGLRVVRVRVAAIVSVPKIGPIPTPLPESTGQNHPIAVRTAES